MTPSQFRECALSIDGAIEQQHGGHPDFRLGGKVFASLGSPDDCWAMVKLTPRQQETFLQANGAVYRPCNGAWGAKGFTNLLLEDANIDDVREVLQIAAENVAK